tara:strand:+ start:8165 stop:8362 length:198 start_codon:yes stop_codon:yes gene_type:complete
MDKMTWQEFRAYHKGKKQKEISALWKIYKETPENEVKRDPEEQKVLNKLNVKAVPRTLALKRFLY